MHLAKQTNEEVFYHFLLVSPSILLSAFFNNVLLASYNGFNNAEQVVGRMSPLSRLLKDSPADIGYMPIYNLRTASHCHICWISSNDLPFVSGTIL